MRSRSALLALSPLVLGLIGLLLWGYPGDPDVAFPGAKVFGVFLLFLFFAASLFAWGSLLSRALGLDRVGPLVSAALGTVAGALMMGLLGHLGLIGSGWDWLGISLLLLAPMLQALKAARSERSFRMSLATFGAIVAGLSVVALRLASASLAHGTSDPFLYHLVAPRVWWNEGSIIVPSFLPISFQATYWEYLMGWGNTLFASAPNRGLIEVHLFAQFGQVLLGLGVCWMALYSLGRKLGATITTATAFALVGISSDTLWSFSWLAKNDWGAMSWTLVALVVLLSRAELSNLTRWSVTGLFAGIAIAAKWNMGLLLIPSISLLLLNEPKGLRLRAVLTIAGEAALASLPILLRNWLLTGNPLFPFLHSVFPSPLLSMNDSLIAGRMKGSLRTPLEWAQELATLMRDNPFSWGILLVPALPRLSRNRAAKAALPIAAAAIFSYAYYASRQSQLTFSRWIGAGLLLVPALGYLGAVSLCERLLGERISRVLVVASIALLVGYHIQTDFKRAVTAFTGPEPSHVIRNDELHFGGSAKAWLRLNAAPTDLIISTGDNQIYYLLGFNIRVIGSDPALDNMAKAERPSEILSQLDSLHARFLLDTEHWQSRYWGKAAYLLGQLIDANPASIVHQGTRTRVIDVEKLKSAPVR